MDLSPFDDTRKPIFPSEGDDDASPDNIKRIGYSKLQPIGAAGDHGPMLLPERPSNMKYPYDEQPSSTSSSTNISQPAKPPQSESHHFEEPTQITAVASTAHSPDHEQYHFPSSQDRNNSAAEDEPQLSSSAWKILLWVFVGIVALAVVLLIVRWSFYPPQTATMESNNVSGGHHRPDFNQATSPTIIGESSLSPAAAKELAQIQVPSLIQFESGPSSKVQW